MNQSQDDMAQWMLDNLAGIFQGDGSPTLSVSRQLELLKFYEWAFMQLDIDNREALVNRYEVETGMEVNFGRE